MAYSDAINLLSPVAYWRLGESDTSSTAEDETTNYDGTYVNSPTSVTGLLVNDDDTAVEFDGVDQYVDCDTLVSELATHTAGSIVGLFKIPVDGMCSIAASYDTSNNTHIHIYANESGVHYVFRDNTDSYGVNYFTVDTVATLTADTVYHVAVTQDASLGAKIYINGVLQSITNNGTVGDKWFADITFNTVSINAIPTLAATYYRDGIVDEVVVFDSILTQLQLTDLYLVSLGHITGTIDTTSESITSSLIGNIPLTGDIISELGSITSNLTGKSNNPVIGDISSTLDNITSNLTGSVLNILSEEINEALSNTDSNTPSLVTVSALSEILNNTDILNYTYTANVTINESITLSEKLFILIQEIINESIIYNDSTIATKISNLLLQEAIAQTSSSSTTSIMLQNISELINVLDTNLLKWLITVSENINAQDTVNGLYKLLAEANEVITQSDTASFDVYIIAVLKENITQSDNVDTTFNFNVLLNELISLTGGIDLGNGEYYTFVANTKTLALSEYIKYDFNSISEGLAANATGIYNLNDSTDNEQIEAEIRTGLMDFGTSKHKQFPYAYLGLTNDGEIILKVNTIRSGIRSERFYKLNQNTAATDTRRVQLGKGVKGDLWQFAISNVDGADFSLDQLEVLPLVLTRRI